MSDRDSDESTREQSLWLTPREKEKGSEAAFPFGGVRDLEAFANRRCTTASDSLLCLMKSNEKPLQGNVVSLLIRLGFQFIRFPMPAEDGLLFF